MPVGSRKKIGIALSGGFIRASAQIGVLEVLEEHGIPIDMIAGCSSGSAIAGAYAAGNLGQFKKTFSAGTRWDYWRVIFEPTVPRQGLFKGERSRKFFEQFIGPKEFADLKVPLLITATDLRTMKEVVIDEGLVGKAIQASTAVPGVFVPVEWGDYLLGDGGNFNLIPSRCLFERGCEYVIAVDVSKAPNRFTRMIAVLKNQFRSAAELQKIPVVAKRHLNIFSLAWRTITLSTNQIKNLYSDSYHYSALIRPNLRHVKRVNVGLFDYCIAEGRIAALEALPKIKRDLELP